jgi:replicative DNA helicase
MVNTNAELAIIGHAFENRDDYELLMAEFTPDHFTQPEVRYIFERMMQIVESGRKPRFDDLTKDTRSFPVAMSAWDASKASLDHEQDFNVVRNAYFKNQYRRMADELAQLVSREFGLKEAEDVISRFMPYSKEGSNKDYIVTAEEAAQKARDELEERLANPDVIPGISLSYKTDVGSTVGFKSIDDVLYGLRGGDLIMIAAQSGHGKTALAMNLSRIISFHNNKRLYYLNTEMDVAQMVRRWAAMATRIDYSELEKVHTMQPSDVEKYREWLDVFEKSPVLVSRIPSLSPKLAKALIQRTEGKHGKIDCVIVDYVGRMNLDNTRNMQEWQIMSAISQELKEIAQELNVPIIALAQLNDSGGLEGAKKMRNECDGLFYFRPKKVESTDEVGNKTTTFSDFEYFLIKEKVRRGSTDGVIPCEFYKKYQFIREV